MTNRQKGFIVPTILIFLLFFIAIGTLTMSLISNNYNVAHFENYRLYAQLAADGGADRIIGRINDNPDWTGVSEEEVMSSAGIRTTFSGTSVNDPDPAVDKKYVTVIGRVYSPADSPKPRNELKYEITLRGVGGGSYSVITGVGGLVMSNSAKIVDGDVFVNGSITMSNSAQIGLSARPVSVKAANQNCPTPPDSTYPRVCNPGENDNPIKLFNSARIHGDVQATYQTNGSGMVNNGLQPGSPAPLPMPTHDRSGIIAAINASGSTMTGASASCTTNGGSRVWPANTKIVGDVTVSKKCTVTVRGDVWITGNLSLTQSGTIIVNETLTEQPNIMIDGSNGLRLGNSSTLASNSANVGFRVVTYWSAASCRPNCPDVTGVELKNSQDRTTIDINNGGSGPNTEFYARWSRVSVGNSGNIGSVVGQTVDLNNSAAITFGAPVSGAESPKTWVVQSYRRLY